MTDAPPLAVLVAEDDEDDQLILEEAFAALGAPVELHFARDGVALVERLTTWPDAAPWPLILIDLNMPRMNGWEVLEAVRAHPTYGRVPVLVMSTSGAPEDVDRAYASGANTFFTKPLRFHDLTRTLDCIVQYWRGPARWPTLTGRGGAPAGR